jgi:2-polyprenyl-3-methyl-5-hydroxy-6-metoxy-1,4-benzoquinol methylase
MKVLVALASYGTNNDRYLAELIKSYRSMPYAVDIVVLSNLAKDVPGDAEVLVGLPTKNPWSLPFAHKKLFADRLNEYDLFIYSEDDTLISQRNIEAFLRVTQILPKDQVAGFLRFEVRDGKRYFCDVHGRYHWDPSFTEERGDHRFAFFSNEHAACYLLTKEQLQKAITSGGFLVPPHDEKYDLLCAAATDPYTQCGLKKVICISHLQDFLIPHLPNKYIGQFGLQEGQFRAQVEALMKVDQHASCRAKLFETQTKLPGHRYSKLYYEAANEDVLRLIRTDAKTILSVGCGWGELEGKLVQKGKRVVAIPLDSIIGVNAKARGVELVCGDLSNALQELENERFDCLLLSNVLHLVPDPQGLLFRFCSLLRANGTAVAVVPNLSRVPVLWRRGLGHSGFRNLADYQKSGVNLTSRRILRKWFDKAGMKIEQIIGIIPPRLDTANRASFGLALPALASDFIALALKV